VSPGRNDPCPCGSGLKYKHCCQKLEALASLDAAPASASRQTGKQAAAWSYNEALSLHEQGRLDEAIAAYRKALARDPGLVVAHNNLGNALAGRGRTEEAAAAYRRALDFNPRHVEAHYNLALLHERHGRHADAARSYEQVIRLRPLAAPFNNLGNCYNALGLVDAALASYRRALALEDTPEIRANLARALRHTSTTAFDAPLRDLLARVIAEAWTRPEHLAFAAMNVLLIDPVMAKGVARAAAAWPARVPPHELLDATDLAALAADPLLAAVLVSASVCDVAVERFLVNVRYALLVAAESDVHLDSAVESFYAAVAMQCWLNERVWDETAEEQAAIAALRDRVDAALDQGHPPTALQLVAVAAYLGLPALRQAARLDRKGASPGVQRVFVQQLDEPAREVAYRAAMPVLTPITDTVSVAVRAQYEANPYPRWIRLSRPVRATTLPAYLAEHFGPGIGEAQVASILIAGCGTGQEAIETAAQFPSTQVVAVDLSLASLVYAQRKAEELGVRNLEFAQADLLELPALRRTFDAASSVGVLHHLADPLAGLRAVAACVRPGGFLRLGFYSEAARQDVAAARAFMAERKYATDAAGIRRCRQHLLAEGARFETLTNWRDFYTTSECRDLLFHVQEHRLTLSTIDAMLDGCGLRLLGFLVEPYVLAAYRSRFPNDPTATHLDHWAAFEAERPYTFAGMYRFWTRKVG
jgi:SAM-dependent methyltransferase/Flp pilus assembly protein TadD